MCLRFAELERKLGEIDRARAVYAHTSQICDPRVSEWVMVNLLISLSTSNVVAGGWGNIFKYVIHLVFAKLSDSKVADLLHIG